MRSVCDIERELEESFKNLNRLKNKIKSERDKYSTNHKKLIEKMKSNIIFCNKQEYHKLLINKSRIGNDIMKLLLKEDVFLVKIIKKEEEKFYLITSNRANFNRKVNRR